MPRVLNKKHDTIPATAVYIGRPSKWGNPFKLGKDGTREQVIELYKQHLKDSGLVHCVSILEGKDLVCWCAPLACHGDVLLRLANANLFKRKEQNDAL